MTKCSQPATMNERRLPPRRALPAVLGLCCLLALSGCANMAANMAKGLDRKAIQKQLRQGQTREEVKLIVGAPQWSEYGANCKTLDSYYMLNDESSGYARTPGLGEGPEMTWTGFLTGRSLSVLYDPQDRLEKFLHHIGRIAMSGGKAGASSGRSLAEEKLSRISRGSTNRDDLLRLFGKEEEEYLNVDGENVMRWDSWATEGGAFNSKMRSLMVTLDSRSMVKDARIYDKSDLRGSKRSAPVNCQENKPRAEQGDASAQNILSYCYEIGAGVQKDLGESMKWLRKAAEQNYAVAQYNLGLDYHLGTGVEKNPAEAAGWYRKAAEQNDADAQFRLAALYHAGEGVEKSGSDAVKWYGKAAERGHVEAQFYLGSYYQAGAGGLKKDAVEAYMWLSLAAKTSEKAEASRKKLKKSMSSEEVEGALSQATEQEAEIEARLKAEACKGR